MSPSGSTCVELPDRAHSQANVDKLASDPVSDAGVVTRGQSGPDLTPVEHQRRYARPASRLPARGLDLLAAHHGCPGVPSLTRCRPAARTLRVDCRRQVAGKWFFSWHAGSRVRDLRGLAAEPILRMATAPRGSRVQISPARLIHSNPSDLVGPGTHPTLRPPSMTPSGGRSGPTTDHQVENAVPASSMACTSECRMCRSTPASAIQVRAVCRRPWRTSPGCPSSVNKASQPVASRKVAVVMTPSGDPAMCRSSLRRAAVNRTSVGRGADR